MEYLDDIFESLNLLNRHLQDSHTSRIDHSDFTRAFIEKLELWFRRVQRGNTAFFSNFDAVLEKNQVGLDAKLNARIEAHLQSLKQEFERCFPDLANTEFSKWKLAKDLFRFCCLLPDKTQEEFLELKCNSVAKDDFKTMPLNDFWVKHVRVYRNIDNAAMSISFHFQPHVCMKAAFLNL